jgi:hypothetical protein
MEQAPAAPESALASFETAIGLVDDVDPPLAAYQPVVAVPAAQGFQGVADFHGNLWLLCAGYIRSPPGHVNVSCPPVVTGTGLLYSPGREF